MTKVLFEKNYKDILTLTKNIKKPIDKINYVKSSKYNDFLSGEIFIGRIYAFDICDIFETIELYNKIIESSDDEYSISIAYYDIGIFCYKTRSFDQSHLLLKESVAYGNRNAISALSSLFNSNGKPGNRCKFK